MIKKILLSKEEKKLLLNDTFKITIPDGKENNVDYDVREEYLKIYNNNKEIVKLNETGIKSIDKYIESVNGISKGELDVLIFNSNGNSNIDLIIENKKKGKKENPLLQAEMYANSLNRSGKVRCRIIIGNVPTVELRVLVDDEWKPLYINGKQVNEFIGKNIIELIYKYPNTNEFNLEEIKEHLFTQKNLHNVINKLKTLYRQIPEIQNNDELSINFTVSFVALKMIMEKQNKKWNLLITPEDIIKEVSNIIGTKANIELKEKYYDIFIMKNKDENEIFNFKSILTGIDNREYKEGIEPKKSIIMDIHNEINSIPDTNLEIDLFGEVYETLASKKTKSSLGEFFTRRHIIRPLVRMFFNDNDIMNIIENKKIVSDIACGFRVIIMTRANSQVNTRVLELLPKFKIKQMNSWCAV